MPNPTLHATRAAPTDADGRSAAPRLPGATEPFVPRHPETRAAWLRRKAPGAAFSALFHAAATVGFVLLWRSMVQDLGAPEEIPVEIVSSIPGEGPAASASAKSPEEKSPEAKSPEGKSPEAKSPEPKPDAPAPTPAPAPAPAPKPADVLRNALAMPEAPPAGGAPGDPSPPAQPTPTPGNKGDNPSPLAAPPPEPKAAATQPDRDEKPNTAQDAPKTPTAPAPTPPAPAAPAVLTAPGGDTSVPEAAPESESKAQAQAPEPQPDATAKDSSANLAAALPMSINAMQPPSFRAAVSAQGYSKSQQYKGAVFGALTRAVSAVQAEAQRRRLKGQVAVQITVTDTGALASAAVVQSSGSDATDALALDVVRKAAPFPPPPPGTTHTFVPVVIVGEE